MANRIGILNEGRLIQVGTPREIYESPKSLYVAARLGQPTINLVPAGLLPDGGSPAGTKTILKPCGARATALPCTWSIPPEAGPQQIPALINATISA